jgi:hypothetical protein
MMQDEHVVKKALFSASILKSQYFSYNLRILKKRLIDYRLPATL